MNRMILGAALVVALAGSVPVFVSGCAGNGGQSAPEKVRVKTETITYMVEGKQYRGVLAYSPDFKGPRAGVLVCHEWWGNNAYSQARATQLATMGYVAFALDMYGDGKSTTKPDEAGKWAGEVYSNIDSMRARVNAARDVLVKSGRVDEKRVAAIGYCFGGSVALELARSGADVKAIAAFHTSGLAAKNADDNKKIKGEVLACNGAADPMSTRENVQAFRAAMEAAGVKCTIVNYEGAVHAFTNPEADSFNIPGVKYDALADKASWEEMKKLFARTVGK